MITSFLDQLLDKIFSEFVSIWMNMKDEVKTKENHNAQQYQFRPRVFKVDRVFEVEKSSLRKLFASDAFSEWQELLLEEEFAEEVMVLCQMQTDYDCLHLHFFILMSFYCLFTHLNEFSWKLLMNKKVWRKNGTSCRNLFWST